MFQLPLNSWFPNRALSNRRSLELGELEIRHCSAAGQGINQNGSIRGPGWHACGSHNWSEHITAPHNCDCLGPIGYFFTADNGMSQAGHPKTLCKHFTFVVWCFTIIFVFCDNFFPPQTTKRCSECQPAKHIMMTSSNGNICRDTGHLCGEFGPVNSPHKGQCRGPLVFSLICVWINGWVNNREAGDLRRYRAHYDVIAMWMVHVWTNHMEITGNKYRWLLSPINRAYAWINVKEMFTGTFYVVWVCHLGDI